MDKGYNGTGIFGLGGKEKFPRFPRSRPGSKIENNSLKILFRPVSVFMF